MIPAGAARESDYFVLKLGALGDVVQCTALLRDLRAACPQARIVVGTTAVCADLLRGHPAVDACLELPGGVNGSACAGWQAWRRGYGLWRQLRSHRSGVAIVAHRHPSLALALRAAGFRRIAGFAPQPAAAWRGITHPAPFDPHRHRLLVQQELLRALGLAPAGLPPQLALRSAELAAGERRWRQFAGLRPRVAIAPGGAANAWSAMPNRRWPRERFHALAAWLARNHAAVAWVGALPDRVLTAGVAVGAQDWIGQLALRETLGVMARADLLIGNDSAPLHMAAALQTPCLGLFGPTSGERIMPAHAGPMLQGRVPCGPCYNSLHGLNSQAYRCPRARCMEAITVAEVCSALRPWLAGGADRELAAKIPVASVARCDAAHPAPEGVSA